MKHLQARVSIHIHDMHTHAPKSSNTWVMRSRALLPKSPIPIRKQRHTGFPTQIGHNAHGQMLVPWTRTNQSRRPEDRSQGPRPTETDKPGRFHTDQVEWVSVDVWVDPIQTSFIAKKTKKKKNKITKRCSHDRQYFETERPKQSGA